MHALTRRVILTACSGAHRRPASSAILQTPMKDWDARALISSTTPTGLPGDVFGDVMSQVLEFAPNGFALTMSDGSIVLVNAELERMFGYSRTQLLASHIERLLPKRFHEGHALLRDGNWNDFKPRNMGAGREFFGLRADGSEFPIEIGINALQTPQGMLVVETIADISVRKRLEKMFQKIVEAAPCGIVMIDDQGHIAMINPQVESMFGYERSELIGSPLEILLPERLRAAHGPQRRAFTAAPALRQMGVGRDLTARRKDGSEFPVEIGLNPVAGSPEGLVLAMVTDITKRNTMQLELRQANANLEEFMYAASHDLKSPLRGIADLVEWISEDLGSSAAPDVARNLVRVNDRVRRLDRVIDDLLAYARAGATSSDEVMVDPQAVIDALLELLPRPPGFTVTTHITAQPFVTSRAPLESMLLNLISNAINHHDRPVGAIDIRAEDDGRCCVFRIADDGPGIPPAQHERVFRMFQSLARGARLHSGIGLALTKRLVEAHGGWMKLDSVEGVRGATFSVWWPRFQWRKDDD
jgi:PAS domain S-box-containing protein